MYALENRLSVAKLRAEMRAADEEAQRQISQLVPGADSPTLEDGDLWGENGQISPVISSVITESTPQMVQMRLWDDVQWDDFNRRVTRLQNVARGTLTMSRDELLADIAAQRRLLDALERKARGESKGSPSWGHGSLAVECVLGEV
jgi:hypothetical protein